MRRSADVGEFIVVKGVFVLTALGLGKLGAVLLGPARLAPFVAFYGFLAAVMIAGWVVAWLVKRALFKDYH